MSNQIKIGSIKIKDTFYTLTPVNWLLRIFVLSNVIKKQNQLHRCWSWTEAVIILSTMLIVNIFCLVIKIQRFEGSLFGDIKFTDSLQLNYLFGFAEYIIDLFYVYKMRNSCVKYLQFYANIDKILGVPNFERIRMKNLTSVVLFVISFIVSSLFDYISWAFAHGWITPMLYSLDYAFGFINALTILDVISNVIQIEYRVKVILGYIEEYYGTSLVLDGDMNEIYLENVEKPKVDRLKTISYSKAVGVMSLNKCYVMLMEQVHFINTAYGIRLGAFCLNILMSLIYLINIIVRIMIGQFMITYPTYHLANASTVLRIINYAVVLLVLVYRCEQTYKLCGSIVRLVDLTVVSKKIPTEMKTSLLELRALVLSRPVRFHGANFFTLDYPLLVSVASVVFTYSIIMLQSMK